MAGIRRLPCNRHGVCMVCKTTPSEYEKLLCIICYALWHASCIDIPQETVATVLDWERPDCTTNAFGTFIDGLIRENPELATAMRAIEDDPSLTEYQKAKKRQALMSGHVSDIKGKRKMEEESADSEDFNQHIQCGICLQLLERPVTKGKHVCPSCAPSKVATKQRINSVQTKAIEETKKSTRSEFGVRSTRTNNHADRPDTAFPSERAKKAGLENASSGRIFVTVPSDHFGPITAENDPETNRGVLVGDCWESRMQVRQWGVHLPPVSGISGQSKTGAQSVVLSGGYKDDQDDGDWFIYTGSGGRDLTGNKRTNKTQSSDQDFVNFNEALRVSCKQGYPVRVVRSYKYKRSDYAPDEGYRYDGIYRIERCWRIVGVEGFLVCQYLFLRCDNEAAPWRSSYKRLDLSVRSQNIPGFHEAVDICEREENESPSWDFDWVECRWKWIKPPPRSKAVIASGGTKNRKRSRNNELEMFDCVLCTQVLKQPVTAPCGHSFCKSCLEVKFGDQSSVNERSEGGHPLRVQQTNSSNCPYPKCPDDISDFLLNSQVNTELEDIIRKLHHGREMTGETSYLSDGEDMEGGDDNGGSDSEETI